jgi:hypothetical protein
MNCRTETAGDSSAVTVENGSVDAAPSTNANESSLSGGKVEEVSRTSYNVPVLLIN